MRVHLVRHEAVSDSTDALTECELLGGLVVELHAE